MNKDQLDSIFDSFSPTHSQKQKMLEKINNKTFNKKIIDFKKLYIPAACAVAAAIILAVGIGGLRENKTTPDSIEFIQHDEQAVNLVLNDMPQMPKGRMTDYAPQAIKEDLPDLSNDQTKNATNHDESIISADIPKDMELTTESDMHDMTYIGENARCINITVNENTDINNEYLNDDNYKKTYVSGNKAVVFYDGIYTIYMNVNDISYKITAIDISEEEISTLLLSLTTQEKS